MCYNGTTVGSAATYSCLNCGYTLQGSDTRRCLMDETWSGRTPLCDCKYSCIANMFGHSASLIVKILCGLCFVGITKFNKMFIFSYRPS